MEKKRQLLNQEKIKLQSTHPGFSKDVLLYDTINDEWKTIDSLPFEVTGNYHGDPIGTMGCIRYQW